MTIRRGDMTKNGIVLENGTQVLIDGEPGVVVIKVGTVSPVRLFVPRGPGGQWASKWRDLDNAVRETNNVVQYGYAAVPGKRGGIKEIRVAPLQPNTDPATFVDYEAYSEEYEQIYAG